MATINEEPMTVKVLQGPNLEMLVLSLDSAMSQGMVTLLLSYTSGPYLGKTAAVSVQGWNVVLINKYRMPKNTVEAKLVSHSEQFELYMRYNYFDRKGVGLLS